MRHLYRPLVGLSPPGCPRRVAVAETLVTPEVVQNKGLAESRRPCSDSGILIAPPSVGPGENTVLAADPIGLDQLPEPYRSGEVGSQALSSSDSSADQLSLREFRERCEKQYIKAVLESSEWNVSEAARRLGIHRSRLHQKMNELGIRRS